MRIIILVLLVISGLTAAACTGEAPSPADTQTASRPTVDVPATVEAGVSGTREAETAIDATVEAKVAAALTTTTSIPGPTNTPRPTATPYPTATPGPTNTPRPTATPYPTATPGPTNTPRPTATPYPTATPGPTNTPRPTATPYPTATPGPTNTPRPTATPYPTAVPQPTPTPEPTLTPRPTPIPTAAPTPTPAGSTIIPLGLAPLVPGSCGDGTYDTPVPVTSLLGGNKSPSWRPDCAEIAYVQNAGVSVMKPDGEHLRDLYRYEPGGSVAASAANWTAWSPDGTKLKPRWDVHLSGDDDQLGCAGKSLSSVLGE